MLNQRHHDHMTTPMENLLIYILGKDNELPVNIKWWYFSIDDAAWNPLDRIYINLIVGFVMK